MADERLTGWQLVTLECVKLLVPVLLALVAIWQADKAGDKAADAGRKADAAHVEASKALRYYGAK